MKAKQLVDYVKAFILALILLTPPAFAASPAKIEYLQPVPLVNTLKSTSAMPVRTDVLNVPTITWAGDISTIFAHQTGAFEQEGLKNVKLFKEDNFAKQVQDCLNGKTPYVRGTLGMVNSAEEAFEKAGVPLVVIYQLTWSSGGDCMVVRPGTNTLTELNGKTIALQLYGPHMDFVNTIIEKAGLDRSNVKFKWLRNLALPLNESVVADDTVSAFQRDPSINACMVIAPDAGTLTNGNGAEGSVKGAKTLITSAAANRIISDVYAVRKDYFDAHRGEVQKFVHALMVGQERFDALMANKAANQAAYNELIKRAAIMQYGDDSKQSKDFASGSLGDCTWVGFNGNVQFFTGRGTSRNFTQLNSEIQPEFRALGLIKGSPKLVSANWDYNQLATGLRNADVNALPKPLLSQKQADKVKAKASQLIAAEPEAWESNGTLYSFEINFQPNQTSFDSVEYNDSFKRVLELSQSLGGAVVFVEGHCAPNNTLNLKWALDSAKKNNATPAAVGILTQQLGEQQQAAKTLGLNRAKAVCDAYARYCRAHGQDFDASQLQPVSLGADRPKVDIVPADLQPQNRPVLKAKSYKCMRVVFRLKQVAAEPTFE